MIALLIAALLVVWSPGAHGAYLSCRAIDGDTLRCGTERVRLRSVHAPDRGEAGAVEATRKLDARVRDRPVRLVRHARDRWGRTIADVYVRGVRIEQRHIGPRGGRSIR